VIVAINAHVIAAVLRERIVPAAQTVPVVVTARKKTKSPKR
jgi:hypothetical protein